MPPSKSRKIAAAMTAPAALPTTPASAVTTAGSAHIQPAMIFPSEIIADIFGWLVLMWPPYSPGRPEGLSLLLPPALEMPSVWSLGWIQVTHICRRWRSIALENACLWAKINLELGPRWTNEMRLRARNVPLEIKISTGWENRYSWKVPLPSWQCEFILLHLAEFAVLSLETDSETLAMVVAALDQPTPSLRELSLHPTDPDVGFTAALLGDSAPQLRTLGLYFCDIPWGSAVFRGLVVLQLEIAGYRSDYQPSFDTRSVPTLEQLLDTLRIAPTLQELTLDLGFIPPDLFNSGNSVAAPLSVSLPQLRRMSLMKDLYVFGRLLTHLDLPSSTEIVLLAYPLGRQDEFDSLHSVMRPLRHRFSPQCSKPLHIISIGGCRDGEFIISAAESQKHDLSPPLEFMLFRDCRNAFWMDWLAHVFSELPQGSLRGIRVRKYLETLPHGVFEHPSTKNVDAIETTSMSCPAVLDVISKTSNTSPPKFTSLPNLKTLIIEFMKPLPKRFLPSYPCKPLKMERVDPFELCPDLVKQLALVLARREYLGARLRSVVLRNIHESSLETIYAIMRANGVDTLRTVVSFE